MGTPENLAREYRERDQKREQEQKKENNMLVELLQKILALATPHKWEEEDGRTYSNRQLEEVQAPVLTPVKVQTLTGLVDLFKLHDALHDAASKPVIHIVRYDHVALIDREVDPWRRRACFAIAETPVPSLTFQFGQFYEPDQFVVMLQTLFEDYEGTDHHKVLNLASNLASEAVNISTDDGVSQTVATRQGVVMKSEVKVVPRVELCPYCTFREIAQPKRELLIRLRTRANATPLIALFEADGGGWRNIAIQTIKSYLMTKLPVADIVA